MQMSFSFKLYGQKYNWGFRLNNICNNTEVKSPLDTIPVLFRSMKKLCDLLGRRWKGPVILQIYSWLGYVCVCCKHVHAFSWCICWYGLLRTLPASSCNEEQICSAMTLEITAVHYCATALTLPEGSLPVSSDFSPQTTLNTNNSELLLRSWSFYSVSFEPRAKHLEVVCVVSIIILEESKAFGCHLITVKLTWIDNLFSISHSCVHGEQ